VTTPGCVPQEIDPDGVEWLKFNLFGVGIVLSGTIGYRLRLFTFIPWGDEMLFSDQDLWIKIGPPAVVCDGLRFANPSYGAITWTFHIHLEVFDEELFLGYLDDFNWIVHGTTGTV